MPPVHIIICNICNMYKGNNINNKSTIPDDVYNREESNNNSYIYQTMM